MTSRDIFSRDNRWFTTSLILTVAVFAVTAIGGFVILPYAQRNVQWSGMWDAICSAAGVSTRSPTAEVVKPDFTVSGAVMTNAPAVANPESIGRGATLAQQCAICHGPTGVSRADSPNLAGQYASVIYKQLLDFRSGARVNAIMTPFAVNLSDQDIRDLSAYYAYLPRLPAYHLPPKETAPQIVMYGAPLRGIAPCGACHGSLDNKPGSPWLEGQSAAYMKSQIEAFASGARRNDISRQMRNIAKAMTAQETAAAAEYYASRPPEAVRAFR